MDPGTLFRTGWALRVDFEARNVCSGGFSVQGTAICRNEVLGRNRVFRAARQQVHHTRDEPSQQPI